MKHPHPPAPQPALASRTQPTHPTLPQRAAGVLILLLLTGCGERASTYDEHSGRYRPTDEVRRDEINREIDKREVEQERERAPGTR